MATSNKHSLTKLPIYDNDQKPLGQSESSKVVRKENSPSAPTKYKSKKQSLPPADGMGLDPMTELSPRLKNGGSMAGKKTPSNKHG